MSLPEASGTGGAALHAETSGESATPLPSRQQLRSHHDTLGSGAEAHDMFLSCPVDNFSVHSSNVGSLSHSSAAVDAPFASVSGQDRDMTPQKTRRRR